MEPEILTWCHQNDLSSVADRLVQEGLTHPKLLKALSKTDPNSITALVTHLQFTFAEKAKFYTAIEAFRSEGTASTQQPHTAEPSEGLEAKSNPSKTQRSDLMDRISSESPSTFSLKVPISPTTMSIHQCVQMAVGNELWETPCWREMNEAIRTHLQYSEEIKSTLASNPNLTINHLGSFVYYSSDARAFGGKSEQSVFSILNCLLVQRDQEKLLPWSQFLYYMFDSKKYLPTVQGKWYRGIDKPMSALSSQYVVGGEICWVAFTSASKDIDIMKNFGGRLKGCWMVIQGVDGIEIPFSLFPKESEVLMFPNCRVRLKSILDKEAKLLLNRPENLDILCFEQIGSTAETKPANEADLNPKQNELGPKQNPNKLETQQGGNLGSDSILRGSNSKPSSGLNSLASSNSMGLQSEPRADETAKEMKKIVDVLESNAPKGSPTLPPKNAHLNSTPEQLPKPSTLNSSGPISVPKPGDPKLRRIKTTLQFKFKLGGTKGSGDSQFDFPFAVSVDNENNIMVADVNNGCIKVFNYYTRSLILKFGTKGNGNGQLDHPTGITRDPHGQRNFFVVDRNNHRVQIFDKKGKFLKRFGSRGSGQGEFDIPTCIAVGTHGNLYVTDRGNNRVQVFNPSGIFLKSFGVSGAGDGEFNWPQGIAFGCENVFVCDYKNSRVQVFNSQGVFLRKFGCEGSKDGELLTPGGVAVDVDGNCVVTDSGNHRIQVFDATGGFVRKFGSVGWSDSEFASPVDVAVGADGDVLVVDQNNNCIKVFG